MAKKEKAVKTAKKMNKGQIHLVIMAFVVICGTFLPFTILIGVGMLPTFVSYIVEKKATKMRVLTIGAMNFAGFSPFFIELLFSKRNFDDAFSIISDPMNIIIMYVAAAVGYMIDWAATTLLNNILYDRGVKRKKYIENRQKEFTDRWGEKVKGTMKLDEDGFPFL